MYASIPNLRLDMCHGMTVGIIGRKGSGKDTVANVLANEYGFYTTRFAKRLYKEVAEAFRIDVAVLEDRNTKESPLSCLTLGACDDGDFWKTALLHLRKEKETNTGSGWFISPMTRDFVLSPRKVLQLWGTEYRRSQDNYYWVKWLEADIAAQDNEFVVIADVREDFEAAYVKRRDRGYNLKTVRPSNPYDSGNGTSSHSSETRVDTLAFDRLLMNDGTLAELQGKVRELVL